MKSFLLTFAFCIVSSSSFAEPRLLYSDTEGMPEPYGQDWFGSLIESDSGSGRVEVLVESEGKLGDFVGVLEVDCINPQNSEWRSVAENLDSEGYGEAAVPAATIRALRRWFCD